jgi:hypothetical protein
MVKERHLGLASDGPGQQGLAGARWSHHQHTLGDLATELLELAGVTEKIHDLRDFFLGLVGPGHVLEGNLDLVLGQHARSTLAEGHGPTPPHATLHLAHEEDPEPDQNEEREPVDKEGHQHARLLRGLGADGDIVLQQLTHQAVVIGGEAGEALPGLLDALDRAPADGHRLDIALAHQIDKGGIGHGLRRRLGGREIVEHGHENDRNDHPEQEIFRHIIHGCYPLAPRLRQKICGDTASYPENMGPT